MTRIITIIMTILISISSLPISVLAESISQKNTETISSYDLGLNFDLSAIPAFGNITGSFVKNVTPQNQMAYSLKINDDTQNTHSYTQGNIDGNYPGQNKLKPVLLAFNYGFNGVAKYGENTEQQQNIEYIATQTMIWLAMVEYLSTDEQTEVTKVVEFVKNYAFKDQVIEVYKKIRKQREEHFENPSFMAEGQNIPTFEMIYDPKILKKYELSLIDQNFITNFYNSNEKIPLISYYQSLSYTQDKINEINFTKSDPSQKYIDMVQLKANQAFEGNTILLSRRKHSEFLDNITLYSANLWLSNDNGISDKITLNTNQEHPLIAQFVSVYLNTQSTPLYIIKKGLDDQNNQIPIPGAEFKIYHTIDDSPLDIKDINGQIIRHISNANGYVTIPNIPKAPAGSFYLKEISSPNGYEQNDTKYELDTSDISKPAQIINHSDIEPGNPPANIIYNTPKLTSITGLKVDSNNGLDNVIDKRPIQGVLFELYLLKNGDINNQVKIAESTTNENGQFEFQDLRYGSYIIKEAIPPLGYDKMPDYQFSIDDTSYQPVIQLKFENNAVLYGIKGLKHDSLIGIPTPINPELKGAVIGLFDVNDNIQSIDTAIDTAISDENGVFEFAKQVRHGNYIVKELIPPKGYLLNTNSVNVNIQQGSQITQVVIPSSDTIINQPILTQIKGLKLDSNNGIANSTQTSPLNGAEFGLFEKNDLINPIAIAISDQNGEFIFTDIRFGSYVIKEIAAPEGFHVTNQTFEIDVNEHSNTDISIPVPFLNDAILISAIKGLKVDTNNGIENATGNSPLAGAEIGLFLEGNLETPVKLSISDQNGEFIFTDIRFGSYFVKEITPPLGYEKDPYFEPIKVTIDQTSPNEIIINKNIENDAILYTIKGLKLDERADISNSTPTPLLGAKMGLFSESDLTNPIDIAISNNDGIFEFVKKVRSGKYKVKELEAPNGFILSDKIIDVDIQIGENNKIIMLETGYLNNAKTNKIIGRKIDSFTEENLQGAIIGLFDSTGNTELSRYTTLEDGKFLFDNLRYGEYIIKEIAPPDDYLLTDEIFKVTINDDYNPIEIIIENQNYNVTVKGDENNPDDYQNNENPKTSEPFNIPTAAIILLASIITFSYSRIKSRKVN